MIDNKRQFGGALPGIFAAALVVVLGGVALFLHYSPEEAQAQDKTGAVLPPTAAPLERPNLADATIPRLSPDADKIMQGEVIKYRDDNGLVHYRVREPFEGVTANGVTTQWHLDAYLGPQVKSMSLKQGKDGRKNTKKMSPPRLVMKDGKMTNANK